MKVLISISNSFVTSEQVHKLKFVFNEWAFNVFQ